MGLRLKVRLLLAALALTVGDILVGADGIHSKVREHVLGPAALTATYSGLCGIGGTLSLSQIKTPPDSHFPRLSTLRRACSWLCRGPGRPDYRLGVPRNHPGQRERDGRSTNERARLERPRRRTKGLPMSPYGVSWTGSSTTRSISGRLTSFRICRRGTRASLSSWVTRRTPFRRTGGQGSAQAFEDAGYLARLLESQDAVAKGYDKMFAKFEKVRKDRFQHVRDITAASGSTRRGSGPGLAWTFRKWATKGYFWFKGGVLRDTRITGYDVQAEDIHVE